MATSLSKTRDAFHELLPPGVGAWQKATLWHFFRAGIELAEKGQVTKDTATICKRAQTEIIPANTVWNLWLAVREAFSHKKDAWMRLVRIAAAGEAGLSHDDLFPNTNGWSQLRRYLAAGLIETVEWRDSLNRRRLKIRITPKGLRFLRMDASAA